MQREQKLLKKHESLTHMLMTNRENEVRKEMERTTINPMKKKVLRIEKEMKALYKGMRQLEKKLAAN